MSDQQPIREVRRGLPLRAADATSQAAPPVPAPEAATTIQPKLRIDFSAAETPDGPAASAARTASTTPSVQPSLPPRLSTPVPAASVTGPWRRFGSLTVPRMVAGIIGTVVILSVLMLAARGFVGLAFMRDFMATYSGITPLPESAPVGLPVWLSWQHFLNVFFMVLIIRSGLQVRAQERPTAFWTSRRQNSQRISLMLWFHQSLDLLWFINGVIFIVLLFATGQWMRVVPTSWAVVPNALSAGLQYATLAWPTEDGWVNYNSLQMLAYFITIFLAAPLAIVTGFRMSTLWPKKATRLSRLYPVEWARALHFPVMQYFVVFTIVHVTLVFATGALRNLNHMYGGQDSDNLVGFALFSASLVIIVGAWLASRTTVLAAIARLFGKVSR